MFIPFKINVTEIDKLTTPTQLSLINFDSRIREAHNFLESKINVSDGVIDAEAIKQGWLPIKSNYHVFISYSHDDKSKAEKLASWLESHGVSCFLDAYYWRNADDLLRTIDDARCKNSSGETYNYKKHNYSTSLIHALLSMAIMEAIKACDFGLFIESENSLILNLNDIQSYTLSPWIYEELNIMTSIEKRIPSWLSKCEIKMFSQDSKMIYESIAPIRMKFTVPLDQLIDLRASELMKPQGKGEVWLNNFIKYCTVKFKDIV